MDRRTSGAAAGPAAVATTGLGGTTDGFEAVPAFLARFGYLDEAPGIAARGGRELDDPISVARTPT